MFTPFAKIENGNLNPNGVGLGLSICRRILSELDGKIWLDKSGSSGTTFCFTMKVWDFNKGATEAECD